jgi:hypothetical protein
LNGGQLERLADLKSEWSARRADLASIASGQLEPINERAGWLGMKHVTVPGR